jgi:hypothetical protein
MYFLGYSIVCFYCVFGWFCFWVLFLNVDLWDFGLAPEKLHELHGVPSCRRCSELVERTFFNHNTPFVRHIPLFWGKPKAPLPIKTVWCLKG